MIGRIAKVRKRDGRLVDFDESKIADAVYKAACAVGMDDRFICDELAGVVTLFLEKRYAGDVPGIEEIQDMVEKVLIETGHARMAKAYILYRDRRARAREQVTVRGEPATGPVVGSAARAVVLPWSKGRIRDALVREADLDAKVADEVAARVEEKVFQCGVRRIHTSAIRALVEAELLLMGYGDRVGRQALVGLARYDVDLLLRTGQGASGRPRGPRDLRGAVADAMLAQYALAEIYSPEVVDAHLEARLHVVDLGAPCEWIAAASVLPATGEPDAWVEATAHRVLRLGELVTRELLIGGLAEAAAPWLGDDPGAAPLAASRRLLGHPAWRALDRRGGRLRFAFSLPADGAAAPMTEALVREHWARFREGDIETLPDLLVRLAPGRVDRAESRTRLLPILAAAAESGRVQLAFERDEGAALMTPWYRVPGAVAEGPALPAAGAVALNVAALAERCEDEAELLERLDTGLVLAIKALRQKRSFLAALQSDPGAPLYRVAAGARPLVAGERGHDFVHLVGVRAAAGALEREPAAVARLAGRLRSYACVRLGEEGRQVRIRAVLAAERDGEAARRFGATAPDGDLDPAPLPPEIDFPSAVVHFDPVSETLRLRYPRDESPSPETLYDALCLLARDPRVRAVRLIPWPDRSVRGSGADH